MLFSLDPVHIRRVLDNLIRNAMEAMPDGGDINLITMLHDGDFVLSLSDTGTGIPEEIIPNLFKTLFTTKTKGMGLGLAFCKRAVEAHGGSISVESRVGEGTKFTFTIPRSK